jgi:hypothetical protein
MAIMENVEYIESAEQLKIIFEIDRLASKYSDYIKLRDDIGFSVQRDYPRNIMYDLPKTSSGKPDVRVIIYVVCEKPPDSDKDKPKKAKLFMRVIPFSRYLSSHWDYNYNDLECPTEDSVQRSKTTPKPIAIESLDEYVYDYDTNTLRDSKNQERTGEQILDSLFDKHCNTTHIFKGLTLRWRMGSRDKVVGLCDLLVQIDQWILKTFFGRTFEPKDPFSGSFKIYQKEDMKLLKTEAIDIYGYKASKNVIITFASFVLIGFSVAYKYSIGNDFFNKMTANNLTMICFTLVSLFLLDHVLPFIFLKIINSLIRLKIKLSFMKFKV